MRVYVIDDKEEYVPIMLDKFAEGHAVPFEVFTDDCGIKKSLFDKGFIFNRFAMSMIVRQGLTHFYIKTANNLNFTEYLRHAEKMSRMVKDDSVLFIDYSEYKRKHGYIDKTLLSPLIPVNFELGGMRYPVFGGIPLASGTLTQDALNGLMELNADIVVRGEDVAKYQTYLQRLLDLRHETSTEKQIIHIKQELLRGLFSEYLHDRGNQELLENLLRETSDLVSHIEHYAESPVCEMKDLLEIRNVDSYVSVHSVNVCVFSVVLGIRLGLEPGILRQLAAGALLHDIGKFLISYAVINKQGDLTMDEYRLYCTHVAEGEEFARTLGCLPPHVCDIIGQHHERLDGSGYPLGLSGREITILSQIVTVADSYEALITSTPKRRGKSREETMSILRIDAEKKQALNRTVYHALNSILHDS